MKKLNVEFCLLITNFMLYHWGEYIDKKQLKCELTHKHNIENVWHIGHFSLQEILGHDCKHFGYGLAVQRTKFHNAQQIFKFLQNINSESFSQQGCHQEENSIEV